MGRLWTLALLAAGLASCGGNSGTDKSLSDTGETMTVPQPEIATLREQGTTGDYALTIPAELAADRLPGIAKDRCGTLTHCSVFAWTDATQTARALPLTDPEVSNLAFRYDLNRVSGMERSLFDCAKFPQPDRASCL